MILFYFAKKSTLISTVAFSVVIISLQAAHSFLTIRPPFQSGSPERLALTHDQLKWFDIEERSQLQVCPFAGVSTNSEAIAGYFLPYNNSQLNVGEFGSNFVANGNVDVIANYFGIYTAAVPVVGNPIQPTLSNYTFQSVLSFRPKHTFAGVGLVYHYHISPCLAKGFWIEVSTPIMYVRNTMGMCERIITSGGPNGNDPQVPEGFVGNMTAAFRQNKFIFGRITGPTSSWGLADIEFKLGYTYGTGCNYHLDTYTGIHIPTGNKPKGEVVFEPIVGQNQHFGIFGGTVAGFKLWSNACSWVSLEIETVGKLFLGNTQIRAFDLYDRQWSRYIWMYTGKSSILGKNPLPGINFFSQACDVEPGSTRDLNTAFVFGNSYLQLEVGYHFFARERETVVLEKQVVVQPALAAIWSNATNTFINGGISRDGATIGNYAGIFNDVRYGAETYIPLTAANIDVETAATPAAVTHTIYATAGYHGAIRHYPAGFNIGASYEFGKQNAAVDRLLVWAKFDIAW